MVRHGQTDWNKARRVQGRTDVPLNDTGRAQAEAAAQCLKAFPLDAVYASPLTRAVDTAAAIAKACGLNAPETLDGLTEIRFGAWEGKVSVELEREFPKLWMDWNWVLHPEICASIGAESADEILARALGSLAHIATRHGKDDCVAVVSHTMPIKLIASRAIGLPLTNVRAIRLDNCGYTDLQLDDDFHGVLHAWNSTGHLRERGLL